MADSSDLSLPRTKLTQEVRRQTRAVRPLMRVWLWPRDELEVLIRARDPMIEWHYEQLGD